jgi:protein phosphatase
MWLRRLVLLVVAVAVIAVSLVLAYQWSQRQYFVGNDNGRVAIYQGVNSELPGVSLHHVFQVEDLRLADLPAFRRSQILDGISADSLEKAQNIVAQLAQLAKPCSTSSLGGVLPTPPSGSSTIGPPAPLQPPPCGRNRTGIGR